MKKVTIPTEEGLPVYALPSLLDSTVRIRVEVDSPIGSLVRAVRAGLSWLMWASFPGADNTEERNDLRNFFLMTLSFTDERPAEEVVSSYNEYTLEELAELVIDTGSAFQLG